MEAATENIIKAYNIAKETGADSICKVLETMFPDIDLAPKADRPVTERIRTFYDAYHALPSNHQAIIEYDAIDAMNEQIGTSASANLYAYAKLSVICAALNEGWEPQFTEDEVRWYPVHFLYTQDELDEMGEEEEKDRGMMMTDDYVTDSCGFAFAGSVHAPSTTRTSVGSRLCLKSETLADYAGRQFISLWADFNLTRK